MAVHVLRCITCQFAPSLSGLMLACCTFWCDGRTSGHIIESAMSALCQKQTSS